MKRLFKIGTRESELAVWQATQVKDLLQQQGVSSELAYVKSEGDMDLHTPLYAMGVQGIFTKTLDIALLSGSIDIAVHSMKDVPTQLAHGIMCAAVLPRANYADVMIPTHDSSFMANPNEIATVATGSIRRIAYWLNRYPHHKIESLRGNIQTRMQKLRQSNWHGGIFAAAALERLGITPQNAVQLDWMLPAPGQGAILVVCRKDDQAAFEICRTFNHGDTEMCTAVERDFLAGLQGGCSTPVGALATVEGNIVKLKGCLLSTDGKLKVDVEETSKIDDSERLGGIAAETVLKNGGKQLI
jgi:hydroxymethylbilane synthase